MKILLLFLILSLISRAEVNLPRLLHCILQLENGEWGKLGGAGCMKRKTWRDRTTLPYECSRSEAQAMPVYLSHLRWIERTLRQEHRAATPETIALAWNVGVTGSRKGSSTSTEDYGRRAANLYFRDP